MLPPPVFSRSTLAAPGPIVSAPLFDYAQHAHSSSSTVPTPQISGYSAAHAYHGQQTHEWSHRAYRGILNATPGGTVLLNLSVYEPFVDNKGHAVIVPVGILV